MAAVLHPVSDCLNASDLTGYELRGEAHVMQWASVQLLNYILSTSGALSAK
jgi:hypothetical protein